jgi:hypothetical protein
MLPARGLQYPVRFWRFVARDRQLGSLVMHRPNDREGDTRLNDAILGAASAAALRHKIALLNIEAEHRAAWYRSHFDPNQPRVPAGRTDGGQWTKEGRGTQVAAKDKPSIGSALLAALHLAIAIVDAYRSKNGLWDLFGKRLGTVSWTRFKGQDIFGSNSTSPTYDFTDWRAAEAMRSRMIQKYPDVMAKGGRGEIPNDALFHAEANVLLRSAARNGGALVGENLEVFTDRAMCNSCKEVLPLLGLELGNPTVTFIDRQGVRRTMRDGEWLK